MIGPQAVNTSQPYDVVLSGRNGASLAGVFDGTETFTAKLWTGDDRAVLATLTAAWDTSLLGNPESLASPVVLLTVPTAAIASLAPGIYRIQVIVNPGTDDIEVWRGDIKLIAAASGAAVAPKVYCTFDQVRTLFRPIEQLITRDASLQSDLAEERALARRWLDRQLVSRAEANLESQAARHGAILPVAAIRPTTGVDAGPEWGPSNIPETTIRDQLDAIRALLADDKLMLADGTAALITAHYTIALACDGQIGETEEATSWQSIGGRHRRRAGRILRGWRAQIDSDDDGVADYELCY